MPVQLFDENTSVKYPLSDFHESPVPDDILVDLSVSAPSALLAGSSSAPTPGTVPDWITPPYSPATPVVLSTAVPGETSKVFLTSLVKRSGVLFVSFEAAPGDPLCHLSVQDPEAFKIYEMEAAEGVTAWVVFGSGVDRDFEYLDMSVPVDARCLVADDPTVKTITVNGVEYPAPRVLTIAFNDAFAVGVDQGWLSVRRNDAFFTDVQYELREDIPSRPYRVYDVGGAFPDAAGDLDIYAYSPATSSSSASESYIGDEPLYDGAYGTAVALGLVVNNIVPQGCRDWYAEFRQKFKLGVGCEGGSSSSGDLSTTSGIELPMDYVFTGCCTQASSSAASSSSSSPSSASSSPFATCGDGCTVRYTHWSLGGCEQCQDELIAIMMGPPSVTPAQYCAGQHQMAGACGTDIVCVAGTPGYETMCGLCCVDNCEGLCETGTRTGPTGLAVSPTGSSAARELAMDECVASYDACPTGTPCCTIEAGLPPGCGILSEYPSGGFFYAEWYLCCGGSPCPSSSSASSSSVASSSSAASSSNYCASPTCEDYSGSAFCNQAKLYVYTDVADCDACVALANSRPCDDDCLDVIGPTALHCSTRYTWGYDLPEPGGKTCTIWCCCQEY